jgi:hypothetical protein
VGEGEYNFDTDQTFMWAFPETNGNDSCGEFIEAPNNKYTSAVAF